ncbi:MAG: type II secretion system secretin GspD [Deltaproteobacteria bacterium]|nr:type II secretion system secretin GspD [Deltaproteobacteria bacterium]
MATTKRRNGRSGLGRALVSAGLLILLCESGMARGAEQAAPGGVAAPSGAPSRLQPGQLPVRNVVPGANPAAATAAAPPAALPARAVAPGAPRATTLPPGSLPAGASSGADDSIVLNFENADIREVIYSLAAAMNINYWVDPRVQGQVTVRTSGKLSRDDLFPIFHQLLRNNGFAAVKAGDLYSIVPAEEGKTKIIGPGRDLADENHFVMNIVKVFHVGAEQMAQTVTPFVSPGGDVIAFARSNLLIVTDIASNADRLTELVRTFDTNTFAELNAKVFKVEHAVLEDLAGELQSILEAYHSTETGSSAYLIPLTRLGAIAVVAQDRAVVMAVEYWMGVLDVESEAGGRRQVHVYRVENSKAVDLAGVLSDVYGEGGGGSRSGRSQRGRSSDAAESGVGLGGGLSRASSGSSASGRRSNSRSGSLGADDSGGTAGGLGGGGGGLGSSSGRGGSSRGGSGSRSRSRSSIGGGGGGGGGGGSVILGGPDSENDLFEQEVRVVEDEVTNSLVILATPRDYQTVRTVLRDLDVVPRQVLIEAMIAEVTLGENDSLSIMQSLQPSNADTKVGTGDQGGSYFDLFGREIRAIGSLGAGGILGTFSSYRDGVEVYRGVIDAQASRGKIKVLSRPHLMTSDNQEARILVGQEVPILTSQSNSTVQTNSTTQILQSVQYRDTGIIIRVLPQVNSEGLVNLELSQEVSEIASAKQSADIQSPTFTTREAETTVVVNSGETIIIGGIISDVMTEDRTGVPYLMDVPVLGRLFGSDSTQRRRTELIILITPYVVRDREEAEAVTDQFRRRVDNVLQEVDKSNPVDPAPHTLILEIDPGAGRDAVAPKASTRVPVPPPDGGPIPLDFDRP